MENKTVKKCLDYIILFIELTEVQRLKNLAVKEQSYELAVKLRDDEKELFKQLPTLEELKELRKNFNHNS